MPRQARLNVLGAPHHIMVRAINTSTIFKDDQDRAQFVERLVENVSAADGRVYARVLMRNHVHILFKSGSEGISTVMRRLLTWYAQYFNRRHGRTGHLFEERYRSIPCDQETYLLALVRYSSESHPDNGRPESGRIRSLCLERPPAYHRQGKMPVDGHRYP